MFRLDLFKMKLNIDRLVNPFQYLSRIEFKAYLMKETAGVSIKNVKLMKYYRNDRLIRIYTRWNKKVGSAKKF